MIEIIVAVEENQLKKMKYEYKNITIGEMADQLELDKLKIGAVLMDGIPKKLNEKLVDNTEIYFLPILSGGC